MSTIVALLRIARRDAARARGRSALICLMIALPVAAITFADVIGRTAQPEPDEVATRGLGTAAYRLSAAAPAGSGLVQAPDPDDGWSTTAEAGDGRVPDLAPLVPPGAKTLSTAEASVEIRTEGGRGDVGWVETAAGDPAFAGRYDVLAGRAPAAPDEVLATPELLERAGIAVGAPLTLTDPRRTVVVTGTVRLAGTRGRETLYALPGTLVGAPGGIDPEAAQRSLHVFGVRPLGWDGVQALNARGVVVFDRSAVAHPPPDADVPYFAQLGDSGDDGALFLALGGVLLVALSSLEVVLLAGAAFAVGARRQSHALALLAATGATARHVRLVVLAGGLVLGAVAAVGGIAAGIVAAALSRGPLESLTETAFARFDLRPLELLGVAGMALVTGVLAAVLPARAAARQDVVAALAGRRGAVRRHWRTPAIGVGMTALGIAAAAAGSLWTAAQQAGGGLPAGQDQLVAALIAGGAILSVLGLVVLSPSLVGAVGRLGARLPRAPRLVVRDAARHRGRSAPATSAVLAAVAGSATLLLVVAATDAHDRRMYVASLPSGTAGVSLAEYRGDEVVLHDAAPVIRAAQRTLPVRDSLVLRELADCYSQRCRGSAVVMPPENACPDGASPPAGDWRCPDTTARQPVVYGALPDRVVGDAALLDRLYGVHGADARATLAAGGVVAFDRRLVHDGHVTLEVYAEGEELRASQDGREAVPTGKVRLPAVYAHGGRAPDAGTLFSPAAAERLGAKVVAGHVLFSLSRAPTQAEEDAAGVAVSASGIDGGLTVERGYESAYGLGLLGLVLAAAVITLGAAGVATGLAQSDARADHATLAAVGADPRLRRRLSGLQAMLIAGLGTSLGVAVGFVPAVALIGALQSLELTVPWVPLLTLLAGIPLLAAAGAYACTPGRLALQRRIGR